PALATGTSCRWAALSSALRGAQTSISSDRTATAIAAAVTTTRISRPASVSLISCGGRPSSVPASACTTERWTRMTRPPSGTTAHPTMRSSLSPPIAWCSRLWSFRRGNHRPAEHRYPRGGAVSAFAVRDPVLLRYPAALAQEHRADAVVHRERNQENGLESRHQHRV